MILYTSDVHCGIDQGFGYTSFDDAQIVLSGIKTDYQVLIDYITETLGGVIGEEYEDPAGQGRITFTEE